MQGSGRLLHIVEGIELPERPLVTVRQEDPPMPKVFVSHSTADREFVEREIIPLLESHNIGNWYSRDNIHATDKWERSILEGLKSCDSFLVVMSCESARSTWVKAEVDWVFNRGKQRVIPVLIEECDPDDFHLRIAGIQHIDFRYDLPTARRQLLTALGVDCTKPPVNPAVPPQSTVANPFVWRAGITDNGSFFNRLREVRRLTDFLQKCQNCQIVGPKRIGKTSLLRHIERTLKNSQLTTVAYLDSLLPQCATLTGWLSLAAGQFQWKPAPATLVQFAESVENSASEGRRLVLCLDEFEKLRSHPVEFTRDFFLTLRACGQQRQCLSILTASQRPLSELFDPADQEVSPFFNIFARIPLGPFPQEQAKEFVALQRPGVLTFTPEEQDAILRFGQGHPLALQVACYHVRESVEQGEPLENALKTAEGDMRAHLPEW